jgi:hypothetical protein
MPVATCVQPELKLGLITFSGTVDAGDILRAMDEVYHAPSWEPTFTLLWDGRGIRSLVLEPEEVGHITSRAVALRPLKSVDPAAGREAVVVAREVDFIAARLLVERTREGRVHEVRVFDVFGDATAWLGLTPDDAERATTACRTLVAGEHRAPMTGSEDGLSSAPVAA